MGENRGLLGGLFDNVEILFFILVFLLLFWGCTGPACYDGKGC